MTDDEFISYEQNLLIAQYRSKPKARATIGILASQLIANQIIAQVRDGFDLTTAIGKQLDILGRYVGAQRALPNFTPLTVYMALPFYADLDAGTVVGFSSYLDVDPPTGDWRLYSTTDATLTMTDGQLRELIQYLIALHASNHSNESIDDILRDFFKGYVTMVDGGDMTITYTHDETNDPFLLFKIVDFIGALPSPAGVRPIVVTV